MKNKAHKVGRNKSSAQAISKVCPRRWSLVSDASAAGGNSGKLNRALLSFLCLDRPHVQAFLIRRCLMWDANIQHLALLLIDKICKENIRPIIYEVKPKRLWRHCSCEKIIIVLKNVMLLLLNNSQWVENTSCHSYKIIHIGLVVKAPL